MMRHTYTYAELEISATAWQEIATKLRAAGYAHTIGVGAPPVIDMQGIGLVSGPDPAVVLAVNQP